MDTLPDYRCSPGGVLLVGINPSPVSVAKGHYFQGRLGKRLWARVARLELLSGATDGREDTAFVAAGNGLTDLVKRPTARASELRPEELAAGAVTLRNNLSDWKPGIILFVFKPPAEFLLGRGKVKPGRCADLDGVPTFLLSGPYAPADEAVRVDRELKTILKALNCFRKS